MLHIVLVEPEIPSNTGNISRTCAVTGAALHLVRPLGFSTDDKSLKRAGLDYWHTLTLFYHDSIEEVWAAYPDARFFYCSTHAAHRYDEVRFCDGDFLVFGKETAGLGEKILVPHADEAIRIPMGDGQRSLNLSNAVAIVVYEALRQNGFSACGEKLSPNRPIFPKKREKRRKKVCFLKNNACILKNLVVVLQCSSFSKEVD